MGFIACCTTQRYRTQSKQPEPAESTSGAHMCLCSIVSLPNNITPNVHTYIFHSRHGRLWEGFCPFSKMSYLLFIIIIIYHRISVSDLLLIFFLLCFLSVVFERFFILSILLPSKCSRYGTYVRHFLPMS